MEDPEKTILADIRSDASISDNDSTAVQNTHDRETTAVEDEPEYLTGIRLYTFFLALLFVVLMIALDISIIATAIPRITDDFHTIADVGWYGAAYLIANACLQPLTGKVYTYFPLKLSFIAFVVVFELGSVLCATSSSSMMLVVGRAVAGIGGSGIANGSMTLIGIASAPNQRPTIIGIIMSMFGVGQLIGPLIGGALTQHASWRWCFWINLPIGAASIAGILAVRLPSQDSKPSLTRSNFLKSFDLVGFVFFAPASIQLLLALQWGGIAYAWSSATIIGLLCGSGVTYIIFIFWERYQGDNAMFPPSLLRQKVIASSLASAFLFNGSILILAYYLPLWFQAVKHASPVTSAVNTLPSFVSQIIFALASGPLSTRIGFFAPFALVGAIIATIGLGLMTTFMPTTSAAKWIGYQILSGTGRGLAFQQPINVMQAALTRSQLSTGMAMVAWAQFFGGAVVLALGQTSFSSLLKTALKTYAPAVDPETVIQAGATDYVNVVASSQVGSVFVAYNSAITKTYFLPTALAALSAFVALGMGWKRVIAKDSAKGKNDSQLNSEREGDAVTKEEIQP